MKMEGGCRETCQLEEEDDEKEEKEVQQQHINLMVKS